MTCGTARLSRLGAYLILSERRREFAPTSQANLTRGNPYVWFTARLESAALPTIPVTLTGR